MAHLWQGVIQEYSAFFTHNILDNIVTLQEGGTPLIHATQLESLFADAKPTIYVKFEGANPTGSFKDRGMTAAVSNAVSHGAKTLVCASTGNTSASAAAYAAKAGLDSAVLVPTGKIAVGKLSQAIAHNAKVLQIDGNFDDCLIVARELSENYPVELVNSVNPARIEGQKTAPFEIIDVLGRPPDIHALPVGNAGNISAYWKGYNEYKVARKCDTLPKMYGFQASGAAPIVLGKKVDNPETIATAIRIGNPASWENALNARDESGGLIDMVTDDEILVAHKLLSKKAAIFCEPASAAGLAGILKLHKQGMLPKKQLIVITCTGHGLKDPSWALKESALDVSEFEPIRVANDVSEVAKVLKL
ncbi:MAG: threonine synthase [Bifidobacteriaceae bacterium]|jgi:threonine synthase|nr:threonine synthase [Bifidobacteriaceae bacterium]